MLFAGIDFAVIAVRAVEHDRRYFTAQQHRNRQRGRRNPVRRIAEMPPHIADFQRRALRAQEADQRVITLQIAQMRLIPTAGRGACVRVSGQIAPKKRGGCQSKFARRIDSQRYSAEQCTDLIARCDQDLRAPIIFATSTGVRRGELLALRWRDVDFDARNVTISQAVEINRLNDYELRVKAPKSKRGARKIPLTDVVVQELKAYRLSQAERLLAPGKRVVANDIIFDRGDGELWHPDSFGKRFSDSLKLTELPKIRLHDLRHSFGSMLNALGVDPVTIAQILGHAQARFTINTYCSSSDTQQRAAIDKISNVTNL